MKLSYFDIHCHVNFDAYDMDRDEVIARAQGKGIGMIIVGTNKESSRKAIEIAEKYKNIYAIIGLHPIEVPCEVFDIDTYRSMASHPKVVGIGECGLDYFHSQEGDIPLQREVFEAQIALANEVKKPLMLHIRNGVNNKNAYKDSLEILEKHARVHGDAHFFAGTLDEARSFIEKGFRISFTGVITFARDYDDIIRTIPLNMIMTETDAPYVAPASHRGERNEPGYVDEVVNTIASVRGEDIEKVKSQLLSNVHELFHISV